MKSTPRSPINHLLFRRREALLHGFEAVAHFLKEALEFFEALFGGGLFTVSMFGGLFVSIG